jgi:hypothetical protein
MVGFLIYRMWEGVDWVLLAQDRDCCEHGNELSGFIKVGVEGEFLDKLNDYWLLKKDSAAWSYLGYESVYLIELAQDGIKS